jgi:hypothetical protein
MDNSPTLTFQEPRLLTKIVLLLLQLNGSDWFGAKETLRLAEGDQVVSMKKRKASKRFPYFLCTDDNLMWELPNKLAHTLITSEIGC